MAEKDLGHVPAEAAASSVRSPGHVSYTPGPWWKGEDAPDYLWSLHIFAAPRSADDDDTEIAWVCCRDDGAQSGDDAPRLLTARANAHLIAAAPDLLATLQMVEREHRASFSEDTETSVRAALVKATGGAP